jgi:LPXTG-motif cell wall-anchored protein
MSGSAKAGVGIGVTIGILALLGVVGFFFWKKRQNQGNSPRGNMGGMPPPPMATRDRSYPSPDQGSIGEKHGYDLELMSHRYEDMLPREEPRHMV